MRRGERRREEDGRLEVEGRWYEVSREEMGGWSRGGVWEVGVSVVESGTWW